MGPKYRVFALVFGCVILSVFILVGCQTQTVPSSVIITPPTKTFQPSPPPTVTSTPTITPTSTTTLTATPTSTSTPVIYGPANFPPDIDPLTGQQVSDQTLLNRRPVIVKVSHFPREGRPQAGLSFTDIVFDYYIGEGTNRFAALYYGQNTEKVNPVRSARLVDGQITRLYQGILAFASADPNVVLPVIYNQLGSRAINASPATCPALCNLPPHDIYSVYANTGLLSQYAADKANVPLNRPNLNGMVFDNRPPQAGQPGESLQVKWNAYNIELWRYEPSTDHYQLWVESVSPKGVISMVPLTDKTTGFQLSFSNVILLFAPYQQFAPTLHDITLFYNQNGRKAVLFRNGQAVEGIWKSPSTDTPIQFYTLDGKPLPLKPGNTWMIITGINSTLNQPTPGQWDLQFYLP